MDDWDDIVREAGEHHGAEEDTSDEVDDFKPTFETPEPEQSDSCKTEAVDHDDTPSVDDEQCRICFSGAEEEPELGRLISPCQCRGTMSKVHINCLNRWRNASAGRKSFYQCDQCGYRYRIQRAKIAGLAENKAALASLAMSFFFLLVLINGFLGNWLLNKARNEDSILGAVFFEGPSAHIDDYAYTSFSYRDSYLPLEAVGQAVDLAQKVVSEKLSLGSNNGKHRSKGRKQGDTEMVRIEYKDADGQSAYRMVRKQKGSKIPGLNKAYDLVKRTASFLAVGISMTGIGSFFWLILTLPLWPLHPFRNGLFRSLRGTRDARGGLSPMGTVLVVLFVIVGLIKSVHMCWRLANRTAKVILQRAETGILEVGA